MYFAAIPYVFDILAMLAYFAWRRRALWWVFNIAFLDVLANYLGMVAYLFDKNAAVDFIVMAKAGYPLAAVGIILIALAIWAAGSWGKIKKIHGRQRLLNS